MKGRDIDCWEEGLGGGAGFSTLVKGFQEREREREMNTKQRLQTNRLSDSPLSLCALLLKQ